MKSNLITSVLLLCVLAGVNPVRAQSTAFTYQGRLNFNGAPVSGSYDFQFAVYDASAAGNLVGGPLTQNAVNVAVGLFVARLDFGAGVFTGPPRWLQISYRPSGNGNFTTMNQRLELTSSPYAIRAQSAGVADSLSAGTVVKSLNGLHDDVTLATDNTLSLKQNGNTLTLSAQGGGGGGGLWSANGSSVYYNAGGVGIGTSTPQATLDVASSGGEVLHLIGAGPSLSFYDTKAGNARHMVQSLGGGLSFFTDSYLTGNGPFNYLIFNNNGNLGVGTFTPQAKLDVASTGNDLLHIIGPGPVLTFYDANTGYARHALQSIGGDLNFLTDTYLNNKGPFNFMVLKNNGNVGIGTSIPAAKLDVASTSNELVHIIGPGPVLSFYDANTGYTRHALQSIGGGMNFLTDSYLAGTGPFNYMVILNNGNVGIGTATPQAKLDVNGVTQTKALTITGGADLAEPFNLSQPTIAKGSVVIIDDENPGKLKLSTQAYDTRVAGIVSGANGIHPGISLHQEGVLEGSQNVALSGRAYALADASNGEIHPGDLLTTSPTPGHAMRVTDNPKAQGAILGKAMTGLKTGRGLVLVLVTLE